MNYRMSMNRKSQFLLITIIIFTVMTLYYFRVREETLQRPSSHFLSSRMNDNFVSATGFSINTPGCRIPDLNPYDRSILKYLKRSPPIQCSDKPPLIESNQTSIWIDRKAIEYYNVTQLSELNCCYSRFWRDEVDLNNINIQIDNTIRMEQKCYSFTESVNIFAEFVQVTCKVSNLTVYKDFHAFIVPKKGTSYSPNEKQAEELSVLIIGADSLSRLNFYRQMPLTKEFMDSMEAIEFFGYNKVHDNTFPNLVPLLSGHTVNEIRDFCWLNESSFFDDCPWMWKNYSAKNYFTAFGEDACLIGLFNYLKNGFLQQPTDYYLRPYMDANERWIGHSKMLNTKYCVGARFASEALLGYALKFSQNMTSSGKKFWGFFWESSLTHDFLNVPEDNDNLFRAFFERLKESNVFNRTFVVFMSDHGMRWGAVRETYQGRMEEHLPFLYLMIPDWFKKRYASAVNNLRVNTRLLATHFDVHETLKDLLDLDRLRVEKLDLRVSEARNDRGISLFLPIPINRTCQSAGIGPTWCTCQKAKKIALTNKYVRKAVKLSVNFLNDLLSDYKQCAKLKLKTILSAHVEGEEDLVKSEARSKVYDYRVNFMTKPGLAKFEATVRHRSDSNEMTVLGYISRINIYGTQSECVSNYQLKLYCFCI